MKNELKLISEKRFIKAKNMLTDAELLLARTLI